MLLMPDIGFWSFVLEKMPDSRFLTQNNRYSFQELVQASSLPCFVIDVSENYRVTAENRIAIPISALPDVLIKTAGGSVNCNLSVCK